MYSNIFEQLNDFYHKKTFDKNWRSDSGNGDKKLDEIQVFLRFLENRKEEIESVDFFDKNFKYKEYVVVGPGDLEYLGQVYQITHGNTSNYQDFQKNKNYQIKKQEKGIQPEAFILSARDIALSDLERCKYYSQDLDKKEDSAVDNVILLKKIDRRYSVRSDYKVKTKWQDIILIFDEGNVSIKNFS